MAPSKACLPAAVKLLAGRDYSERELRQKLTRQGHDQAAIAAAIAVLRGRGYLDDAALTRHLVARYRADAQYGRAGIRARLLRRGLSAADIAAAMRDCGEWDEYSCALRLSMSRFPAAAADDAPRVGRFLASRGFAGETVLRVLRTQCHYGGDE